jgi:hypothetical protein
MTPYTLLPEDFPIYQGAKWSHVLEFQDTAGAALDLTGLGPFALQLAQPTGIILATATCTVDADPTTGLMTVSLTAAQTLNLPITSLSAGLRDAQNNPYFQGAIPVYEFTPIPA